MSLITRMRRQKAVHWSFLSRDKFGNVTYGVPIQIACRWEDRSVEYITTNKERRISHSVVYVDREMKVGDFLKLGLLTSVIDPSPAKIADAYMVQAFNVLPNLRNTETLKRAYL